jgi:HSP20 family protein
MSPLTDMDTNFSSSLEFSPACDVTETDNSFEINFDIPGVNKDDVKVELKDNVLSISGERKSESEKNTKNRHLKERSYGAFQRSFALPSGIDASQVRAEYNNGVLQVSIPKAEESQAKRIDIREGQGGGNKTSQKIESQAKH